MKKKTTAAILLAATMMSSISVEAPGDRDDVIADTSDSRR